MNAKSALKVIPTVETDRENQPADRGPDGRFAPGNKLGVGGPRPGSGRPPKPPDESLVKRLYDLLDENADTALQVLISQLTHEDPKIAQKAAIAVLGKVLPEGRLLKTWEKDRENKAEELLEFQEFIAWKMKKDVEKNAGEVESPEEEGEEEEHGSKTSEQTTEGHTEKHGSGA